MGNNLMKLILICAYIITVVLALGIHSEDSRIGQLAQAITTLKKEMAPAPAKKDTQMAQATATIKKDTKVDKTDEKPQEKRYLPPGAHVELRDADKCQYCAVYRSLENMSYDNWGRSSGPTTVICGKTMKASLSWNKFAHRQAAKHQCFCA